MNNLTNLHLINFLRAWDNHCQEASDQNLIPLLAVIGPTASGKTSLGIALARHFNGEIISADSRQIYQEMDIGTAKPTLAEQQSARHHLINLVLPDQTVSLADYQNLANQTIIQISNQNKLPLLVGGTGLYINAVSQNYQLPASTPNQELRQELTQLATQLGNQSVYAKLIELDPQAAASIHPNNLRYVIRAIEVVSQTKQPRSNLLAPSPYHPFYLNIDWPRAELYRRIEERIDLQLSQGLIEETRYLLSKYDRHLPSLSSLGYQEIGAFLREEDTFENAIVKFKQNTRNYAKRQLTWFRKIKSVYSMPGQELSEIINQLCQ